jgi:ribosomal protein S18 acetylase RimI-like enzyme
MHLATNIRPASHTDFDVVAALLKDFIAHHHRWQPDQFRPAILGFTPAIFQTWLIRPNELHLAAERDGAVAGYAWANRWYNPGTDFTYPRRSAHIAMIVVSPEHRRGGIGSALFRAIETWAEEFGAEYVGLNVSPLNSSAQAFYSAVGYGPAGEFRSKTLRRIKRHEGKP